MNFHSTTSSYVSDRYPFILQTEENGNFHLKPYNDGKGWITIGVGFNLADSTVRSLVLSKLGISDTLLIKDLTKYLADQHLTSTDSDIQIKLDSIMSQYTPGATFKFTDENEIKALFNGPNGNNGLVKTYEDRVNNWAKKYGLGPIPESKERLVLLSLAYNGVLGGKLALAIKADNRAEAWYEIRYGSNGDGLPGLAKRHYYEAEVFGLYNDPTNVAETEAKQVLQMYTRHHQTITAYEALYGVGIDGRVEYYNTIARANNDYSLTGDAQVDTLTEALKIAQDVLIDRYVSQQAIDVTINGEVLVGDYGLNLYDHLIGRDETRPPIPQAPQTSNDLLIGGMGSDELKGLNGDDVLYGEDGNDLLEGGKGHDTLVGGKGFDSYIWHTGDGTDTIIDEDQQGVIIISDGNLKNLIAIGAFIETAPVSGVWTQTRVDGSVLTLTHHSPWRLITADGSEIILGNDWQDGDFGIHIQNATTLPNIDLTLTGDFAPIDAASDADDLGNIKINPNQPEANREDTLYDSPGNDRLQGLGGRDLLDAKRGGDDILEGGADSDVLLGGTGDDHLYGNTEQSFAVLLAEGETGTGTGLRGDLLVGGLGNDKLFGGNGNDALAGGDGADTLVGGLGDDVLLGDDNFINAGKNWSVIQQHRLINQRGLFHSFEVVDANYQRLTQGGDDLIYGGTGADLVFAGFGNDTIDAGTNNDVVFGDAGNDVIQGQSGNDILVGDGYGDVDYGDDTISGGDGNDWLYGTGGNDYLDGGDGNDVLLGDHNGGRVNTDGKDILNGGFGNDTLLGGGNDDLLSGDMGDDTLYGGDGDDALIGGPGNDLLSGDGGDDIYIVNSEETTVIQDNEGHNSLQIATGDSIGNYTLIIDPTSGNAQIVKPNGSNIIIDKALFGTELAINSTDGKLDIVSLREWVGINMNSPVNLTVQTENGNVYGGASSDNLAGLSGNNTLWGGAGNDNINGNAGNDILYGDAGKDTILGGDGNDTLSGGVGDDILDGGPGNDIYLFGATDGHDVIPWQVDLQNDRIQFAAGIQRSDLSLTRKINGDLVISIDGTDADLTLNNWFTSADQITHFQFADGTEISPDDLEALKHPHFLGSSAEDNLNGTEFDDVIQGFDGNDIINGGNGNDILDGGFGIDSYVLKAGNTGLDMVWEQDGESSVIKLEGLNFADLSAQQIGDDLMLSWLSFDQGMVLKNYFVQAHEWIVKDYSGEERQLAEVLSDNNTRRAMIDQIARIEEQFITSWRMEMASELLAGGAVQLGDGRFEQKPVINFNYAQHNYTPISSSHPNSEYGSLYVSPWILTTLNIKNLDIKDLPGTGGYVWGSNNSYDYSVQEVNLDKWTITQSSQDYDQYSYLIVSKSQLLTLEPGISGINISGGFNLRYSAANEPGKYWMTWQEYQKTFAYHQHSIHIDGQVEIISSSLTTSDQQITAQILGNQVLAGQTLPDHMIARIDTNNQSLNAIRVNGSESNDSIAFGSAYAQIIHSNGGDDVIDIEFFDEGPMAKSFLDAGDGNDTVIGGYNDDILIGGNGSDYLQGGAGTDRYILSGTGIDLINPWQRGNWCSGIQTDVIELPEGITYDMLTTQYGSTLFEAGRLMQVSDTLNLNWLGATHAMVVLPFTLPDYNYDTEAFDHVVLRFADGTTVAMETLLAKSQTADNRPFTWSKSMSSNDEGRVWAIPLAAAEFRLGMGEVSVSDYPGGVVFTGNISPDEVRYLKSGNDLLVTLVAGTDTLRLQDWYLRSDEPEARFANDDMWSYWDLSAQGLTLTGTDLNDSLIAADNYGWRLLGLTGNDVLLGGGGSDYLDGGIGHDTLAGEAGNDHYYFGLDSGIDTLSDQTLSGSGDVNTIIIGDGVLPENIIVNSDRNHLILSIAGTDDKLTIQWDKQNGFFVQQVKFANGMVWDWVMLESIAIPLNTPPILINPISEQNGVENRPFSFQVAEDIFLDTDPGDILIYSATLADGSLLPAWLNFNPATKTFSATPGLNDSGTLSLIVTATDQGGLSSSSTFNLNIANLIEGTVYNDTIAGSAGNDFISTGAGNDIINAGDGDDVIVGGKGQDVLNGGAGDDIFLIEGSKSGVDRFEGGPGFDTIQGSAGNDRIRINNFHDAYTVEKIDGGLGINSLIGTQHNDTIDLSATSVVNINSIEGKGGKDRIIGSHSADTLDGGVGNDILTGGSGNDTYVLGRGYGSDRVIENDITADNTDIAQFLAGITVDQIWFKHNKNNLEVSIIGTADKLVIKDWYLDTAHHVEQFKTADGRMLLDNQVDTLVSAMSSFAPPAAGQISLPTNYERILSPVISANWQ